MAKPLSGIKILEVASHVFVPIAGAVLTEQGAEVIKIEEPVGGDPYRGLVTMGLHKMHDGVDPSFQYTNRNKQSVAIDLKKPEGRDLLYRIAAECDVFLTNMRPQARRRISIDVEDIRKHNPSIIYVRGSGYGARGPDAETGGYDAAAYWSRSGMAMAFTPPDAEAPMMQRPAFGDVVGGLTIAGAISAALYRRATTGEPSVVDVSLLGVGMWQLQPDIVHSKLEEPNQRPVVRTRRMTWNPIVGPYRTRDRRFIHLNMMEFDRYWGDFCEVIGRPDLGADPRFATPEGRREHAGTCVELLDEIFASADFEYWCETLKRAKGVWAPMRRARELHDDPQVAANGYLEEVEMGNGSKLTMVASPVQFDEEAHQSTRAPELGEHTETALLNLGLSWDEITALKEKAAIG